MYWNSWEHDPRKVTAWHLQPWLRTWVDFGTNDAGTPKETVFHWHIARQASKKLRPPFIVTVQDYYNNDADVGTWIGCLRVFRTGDGEWVNPMLNSLSCPSQKLEFQEKKTVDAAQPWECVPAENNRFHMLISATSLLIRCNPLRVRTSPPPPPLFPFQCCDAFITLHCRSCNAFFAWALFVWASNATVQAASCLRLLHYLTLYLCLSYLAHLCSLSNSTNISHMTSLLLALHD